MTRDFASWISGVLLACSCLIRTCDAEGFVQRGVHEHGHIALNVAVDGSELVVELQAPAINVVGFEHVPRTSAEEAAVREADNLFRSGRGLIGVPAGAQCSLTRADLTPPHWETSDDAPEGGESDSGQHADYETRLTFHCAAPQRLIWIEPWLIGKLRAVTQTRVNLIVPSGQRSTLAQDPHTRIPLG